MPSGDDERYVDLLMGGIRQIRNFQPKLGTGQAVGREEFVELYMADPLYHWVGFDSPLMYAAHRTSGAMTSLYRNLGSGCEQLFKQLIRDQLGLSGDEIRWAYVATSEEVDSFAGRSEPAIDYSDIFDVARAAEETGDEVPTPATKGKSNTLDGRIDLMDVKVSDRVPALSGWLQRLRNEHQVEWDPLGAVFEVRQGYKSMDSKRQAADIANAAQALSRQRIPVLVVMSQQIDDVLVRRYRASGWGILRGIIGERDPLRSTFAFFEEVLGYDLVAFFERNHHRLRTEVDEVLRTILGA